MQPVTHSQHKGQCSRQKGKHTATWVNVLAVQLRVHQAPGPPPLPAHDHGNFPQLGHRGLDPRHQQHPGHLDPVIGDDEGLHALEHVARQLSIGLHLLDDGQRLLPTLVHELRRREHALHPGLLSGRQQHSRGETGRRRQRRAATAADTSHSCMPTPVQHAIPITNPECTPSSSQAQPGQGEKNIPLNRQTWGSCPSCRRWCAAAPPGSAPAAPLAAWPR